MSSYVLIISVRPVQEFIASARRSRDLWAGSWMLSELAKAVAKSLHDNGAKLIFPYVEYDKDLLPDSPFSVGNKIQVVIQAEDNQKLKEIAEKAKDAAQQRFSNMADDALTKLDSLKSLLRKEEVWDKQVDDYIEVQYAWASFSEESKYNDACKKVSQLLAARKATQDFKASTLTGKNLPKSSLDGARETVLPEELCQEIPENKNLPQQISDLRKRLGLNSSEQLDCVGVMKRLCGDTEQFTPITRVAADSWIEKAKSHPNFAKVKELYEELVDPKRNNLLATRVTGNKSSKDKLSIYQDFEYDGQLLYPSRLEVAINQADGTDKEILTKLQDKLKYIWRDKNIGKPCPYWVMLLADGDKMGELLDKATNQKQHQKITKQLSKFAEEVPDIMRQFQAQCVYSGGDDVLGFVPLDKAVDCAEALQELFSCRMNKAVNYLKEQQPSIEINNPTLSVGLAICHIMTPLGNVRALAKRAEKEAKGDNYPKERQRNALGITLAIRGGATIDMRLRWDEMEIFETFQEWIKGYSNNTKDENKKLSSRIAYDCYDIFMRTDFPPPKGHDDDSITEEFRKYINSLNEIRAAEFNLMLKQARTPNGEKLSDDLKQALTIRLKQISKLEKVQISSCEPNDIAKIDDWKNANNPVKKKKELKTVALDKLAIELIIARWLAAKTQNDLGREN